MNEFVKPTKENKDGKNELNRIYNQIHNRHVKLRFESQIIDFNKMIHGFQKSENRDAPDGIVVVDNNFYMIEHFKISVYARNKKGDKFLEAQNNLYTQVVQKGLGDPSPIGLSPKLDNLKLSFFGCLSDHMESYERYLKNFKKEYENVQPGFILLVEDISNALIRSTEGKDISILDIEEYVEKILNDDKIDGVIVYNPYVFELEGFQDYIVAKDRNQMRLDKENKTLVKEEDCELQLSFEKMIAAVNDKKQELDKKYTVLAQLSENMGIVDEITVFKKD